MTFKLPDNKDDALEKAGIGAEIFRHLFVVQSIFLFSFSLLHDYPCVSSCMPMVPSNTLMAGPVM